MNKLTVFNRTFWKSISSFKYYHDVVKAKFSFSIKYFLMFSLLLGLMIAITISSVLFPEVKKFSERLQTRMPYLYPEELVVTIKNGQLSTNLDQPVRFPLPVELFSDVPPAISDQNQTYLLIIDTQAEVEDFRNSQALLMVTKHHLIVSDVNSSFSVYELSEFDDMTIDKAGFDKFMQSLLPWIKNLPILLIIFSTLVFVCLLPSVRLISLLLLSLLLLIVAKIIRLNLSYKKLYQVGLHSLTLPTLIQVGMASFGLLAPLPFFNSIIFLLYNLVILAELRRTT